LPIASLLFPFPIHFSLFPFLCSYSKERACYDLLYHFSKKFVSLGFYFFVQGWACGCSLYLRRVRIEGEEGRREGEGEGKEKKG
jgi:hypothetical protein